MHWLFSSIADILLNLNFLRKQQRQQYNHILCCPNRHEVKFDHVQPPLKREEAHTHLPHSPDPIQGLLWVLS